MKAPVLAIRYWKLPEDASFLDVLKCIRLDEAHHRNVNHRFADTPTSSPAPQDNSHKKVTE